MRGRILQTASKLFSQKGFANVSIRDICKATGTTAPVIYYHFGSKRGLFEAVARGGISMGKFISKLSKAAESDSPEQGLKDFISVYLSSFPEKAFDPGLYMRDSASLDKTSARMVSEDLDRVRLLTVGLVRKCIDSGMFRKFSSELAADCLLGMLNRVIFQHIHFAKGSDRQSYGDFVRGLFVRGMS